MNSHRAELPWKESPMLPAPATSSIELMGLSSDHLQAWSAFYASFFYLTECAGRGANGEVWRGIIVGDGMKTRVVLKRLFSGKGSHTIQSAWREVYFGRVIGQDQAYTSRYISHFIEHGDIWLVFQDEGISLYQAIFQPEPVGGLMVMVCSGFWKALRSEPKLSIGIIFQILESLSYLHSQKIVHRDVKLENIFIDPVTLLVRLGDFGSALNDPLEPSLYPEAGPSNNEETRRYTPPEFLVEDNISLPRNSSYDLWCVGVLWLELALGSVDLGIETSARDSLCIRNRDCSLKLLKDRIRKRDPLNNDSAFSELKMDLLMSLIAFDPASRVSADGALNHAVFSGMVRKSHIEHPAEVKAPQLMLASTPPRTRGISTAPRLAINVSVETSQGRRSQMEDRTVAVWIDETWFLACVFDGHNGFEIAETLQARIPLHVKDAVGEGHSEKAEALLKHAITAAIREVEISEEGQYGGVVGSTLCCALFNVHGDLAVANVGDSRLLTVEAVREHDWVPVVGGRVKFRSGTKGGRIAEIRSGHVLVTPDDEPNRQMVAKDATSAISPPVRVHQVTVDHKPDIPSEIAYIQDNGGYVSNSTTGRVNGILAISRSVGVRELRPYVRSDPDYFSIDLGNPSSRSIRRLILTTDGVCDVVTNQEIGELGNAKEIVAVASNRAASDNLAVISIDLQWEERAECEVSGSFDDTRLCMQ